MSRPLARRLGRLEAATGVPAEGPFLDIARLGREGRELSGRLLTEPALRGRPIDPEAFSEDDRAVLEEVGAYAGGGAWPGARSRNVGVLG